jgi:ribokinase
MAGDFQDIARRLADRQFLVVGGLNVDQLLRIDGLPSDDGSARIVEYRTAFGGHAGNCACALARLGAGVAVLGCVGTDVEGTALIDDLRSEGVDCSRIRRIGEAASGRSIIPSFPDRRYMLMHRGANDSWPVPADAIEDAVAGFDAVVLFDPVLPFAGHLLNVLERHGTTVYWNPGGLLAAVAETRDHLGKADVVIMNRVEIVSAFGREIEDEVPSMTGVRFIETLGPEGARLSVSGHRVHVDGFPAHTIDETGAGDAFTAAFAAFDTLGFDERTSLRFANAAGASATERGGARDGLLTLQALASRWQLDAGPDDQSLPASPPRTLRMHP